VRPAADGFAALSEIRAELPDIILSDLYMPGMSGFELLSVVRRRFPAIPVVAMSSAFSGAEVPDGIAADAFYEKATGVATLVQTVAAVADRPAPLASRLPDTLAPIWLMGIVHDPDGQSQVTLACPECLRTFSQLLPEPASLIYQATCVYCQTPIAYAVVEGSGMASSHVNPLPKKRLVAPPAIPA
jgi:CheY-like chemotaxis protein